MLLAVIAEIRVTLAFVFAVIDVVVGVVAIRVALADLAAVDSVGDRVRCATAAEAEAREREGDEGDLGEAISHGLCSVRG
jgi:hypothetical protein